MRKLFVAFLLTSLAVSLAFGETDPNSVHPGFKKAVDNGDITTAVNLRRNGISDIYCPASLSSGDAVKLYRNELRNAPETIMESCSPEFLEKIAVKSCANPKNIKLCKAMLAKTKIPKWNPMLEKIIENEVYNESPYFNEEMDKAFSFLIDGYEFYNPFSWPASILSLMEKLKTISSGEHRDGGSACLADISCSAGMNTDLYVKNGFISDEIARFSCRIHPGIDKKISEEKGLNILNCDEIFAFYSDKCGTTPQVIAKNRLDGQGISYYKCDGDAKGWHKVSAIEAGKGAEPCTDDRIGELKQSEQDFRIFRCGENHQWNTYAIKMGNTIWATWDMRKGGKSPGKEDKELLKQQGRENLFERIGHTYTYKEAESACPDGWQLPTAEQFNELKSMVQPEDLLSENWNLARGYNDEIEKTNKWNFNAFWSARYWGADGVKLGVLQKGGHGVYHYEMGMFIKNAKSNWNEDVIIDHKPDFGELNKCYDMNEKEKYDFLFTKDDQTYKEFADSRSFVYYKCENYRSKTIDRRDFDYSKKSFKECVEIVRKDIMDSVNQDWHSYCLQNTRISGVNAEEYFNGRLNVRCVKSDNNLGKVQSTSKKKSPVVAATSSTADDEIAQRKERLKNQKQESASDAAVSVTQDDDDKSSISTTKLLRIAVFSAVAVGGAAAAYMFDKKAKDATATPPTNEQEFKKGHDDAKQNQNVRNISLGVAAAGLVALGISILF